MEKVIVKKGDLPGKVVEERMGKFKVEFSKYKDGSGDKRTSWFENNELKRIW
jgi:hypothetical protein